MKICKTHKAIGLKVWKVSEYLAIKLLLLIRRNYDISNDISELP